MNTKTQTIPVGLGEKTTRRIPLRGLARVGAYIRGKEILILGPGCAGKSKFAQYLQLGIMDIEGRREMTYGVTQSPAFAVSIGGTQGTMFTVRRAIDTPGQVGPTRHATLVAHREPHALIVMLDCSSTLSSTIRWLHLFCSSLDTILRRGSYAQRRLKSIVVVLNKRDKISGRESGQLKEAVTEVLHQHLSVVLGADRVRLIPILECISVQTEQGTALIDEVIRRLAERWEN